MRNFSRSRPFVLEKMTHRIFASKLFGPNFQVHVWCSQENPIRFYITSRAVVPDVTRYYFEWSIVKEGPEENIKILQLLLKMSLWYI
jgi:hypothetical protein